MKDPGTVVELVDIERKKVLGFRYASLKDTEASPGRYVKLLDLAAFCAGMVRLEMNDTDQIGRLRALLEEMRTAER